MRIAFLSSVMSLALLGGCASSPGQMHGMQHPNAGAATDNAAMMANCPMMNAQAGAHGGAQSGATGGESTPHEHPAGAAAATPAGVATDAPAHAPTPPQAGAATMNCPMAQQHHSGEQH